MIDKKDDGGNAYPRPMSRFQNENGNENDYGAEGMTLRQWYVGQALTNPAVVHRAGFNKFSGFVPDLVEKCFKIADAMIEAEKK